MMSLPVCPIWEIPTHPQPFADAITTLHEWALDAAGRRYVSTCPVYTLMQGVENAAARAALQGADMVAADGMPVVWLQKRLGFPTAERLYGPDIMLALCALDGVRHVFYGGAPGVPEQLTERLQGRFPALHVVGAISPPHITVGAEPDEAAVAQLNALDAHVIWVGLGSPKQDLWMHLHRPHLNAPLLIGVGAAFDFHSGAKQQAPLVMRRAGLEWLYRLSQEPRRLGRRYLVYNTRFVLRLLRQPPNRTP